MKRYLLAVLLLSGSAFGQVVNPGGGGGGGNIPSTTSILKGDGSGGAAAATSTDLVSAANTNPTTPLTQAVGGTGINTVVSGVYRWWDSYGACAGVYANGLKDSIAQCSFSKEKAAIPGPGRNFSTAGWAFSNIQNQVFQNVAMTENIVLPPKHENGGGENDSIACASTTATCGVSMRLMQTATWLRLLTPYSARVMASLATATGTWTSDTTNVYVPAGQVTLGYPRLNTTGTGSLTFSLPSSASSVVCLKDRVATTSTATFTVSIDGTLQTDAGSGTTTFSAAPISTNPAPVSPSNAEWYGQCWSVTPNQAHTVVVTVLSGSGTEIEAASTVPPLAQQPYLAVYNVVTDSIWTNAAVWNSITASLITTFQGWGFGHIYPVDLVGGTPGMNTAADLSATEQPPYAGTTAPNHPGPLGQLHMYNTEVAAAAAAGYQFSGTGMGGKNTELGESTMPFRFVPNVSGQTPTWYEKFHLLGDANGPSGLILYSGTSFLGGLATYFDASTGKPWSGKGVIGAFSTVTNGFELCNGTITAANSVLLTSTVVPANHTTTGCIMADGSFSGTAVTAPQQTTGNTSNTNRAGRLLISAAGTTSAPFTFSPPFTQIPSCQGSIENTATNPITPAQAQALSGLVQNVSATSITYTVGTAAAVNTSIAYSCTGVQ